MTFHGPAHQFCPECSSVLRPSTLRCPGCRTWLGAPVSDLTLEPERKLKSLPAVEIRVVEKPKRARKKR